MICHKCGHEIGNNRFCPYCGQDNSISVMSAQEKNSYSGITIEENGEQIHVKSEADSSIFGQYKYSKLFHLFHHKWLSRIIVGVSFIAFVSFIIFVALPFLSIGILSVLAVWLIFRLLN